MKENDLYVTAFGKLGEINEISEITPTLEKFTCEIYGYEHADKINEVRYKMFLKQNKPTQINPFDKIKNTDPSILPPCQNVLINKIKRCNFVCKIWNNTSDPNPLREMKPEDHGWELKEDKYCPKWNPVYHLPTSLLAVEDTAYAQDIPENEDVNQEDDDDDSDENDEDFQF